MKNHRRKYTFAELKLMDALEIYKLVLKRDIIKFPIGFWKSEDHLESCKQITKYLFEEILQFSDEEILKFTSYKLFEDYRLGGMVSNVFNYSPFQAINNAYPNKFKPWEFNCVGNDFWTDKNKYDALDWFFNTKLKFSDDDIKNKLNAKLFYDNGLSGLLSKAFDNSPYKAINFLYPNKFKPWELLNCPINFWNVETLTGALRWTIEEKYKLDIVKDRKKITRKFFKDNNLDGGLVCLFNGSISKAIYETYKNIINKSQLKAITSRYYDPESIREFVRHRLENELNLSIDDLKTKATARFFVNNKLSYPLQVCDSSPYKLLNIVYPNKIKPWELPTVPKNFWNINTAQEAFKWLIEEKLELKNKEDIYKYLTIEVFREYKLNSILDKYFNSSIEEALKIIYPNTFKLTYKCEE